MKKILFILTTILSTLNMQAQNKQTVPQINVSGLGEIKIEPNYAIINIGVNSKNDKSEAAKSANNAIVTKMLKTLKKYKIEDKHIKTTYVNLYKERDYNKKKDYYLASQMFAIELYDLNKYDALINDLIADGANAFNNIELRSTETEKYLTELRAKAVLDAKKKAEDFAKPLGQNVGKAILISDNSHQVFQPYLAMAKTEMYDADSEPNNPEIPTLTKGQLELNVNINISFELL